MQFKYPELLWALFLLLIPIIIHLFQLRRFKKTPFTNVQLLYRVVSESRRSNSLKKWLLLCTRLLLLSALVIGFAQPFFAGKSALTARETVIYLDDSFSMQAKTENATLLSTAVQDLIKTLPKERTFSLFTNEKVFKKVTVKDIQNELLTLSHTSKQLKLGEIGLKASTLFTDSQHTIKDLILISDFQQWMATNPSDTIDGLRPRLVQLVPERLENIAIDTAFISSRSPENIELRAVLSSSTETENIPVSLFNDDKLIAKTAAAFGPNKKAEVSFSLAANEVINGKIEVSDVGLAYDNQLFFNINRKERIKILAVSDTESDYLARIFTKDEFQYAAFSPRSLNYSMLEAQNLIVLNELKAIPNALQTVLISLADRGKSIVFIPAVEGDMASYNQLLANFHNTTLTQAVSATRNITDIAFSHPLYQNVFEKRVTNFQYPKVSEYFRLRSRAPKALSFEDKDAFLVGTDGVYIFTAPISKENSNFKNSPLIVPTFYNIGLNSLRLPQLYNIIGKRVSIDIPVALSKDNILRVAQPGYQFIPLQRSFGDKVSLTFDESPALDGIYGIMEGETTLKSVSFNYPRDESALVYLNMDNFGAETKHRSTTDLLETMEKATKVTELWKWFVILALLFILTEILIQKYLK
ncbi:BatA domain-containing protein [Spongiimicrobium sp. 2-473A-2-J]|uniref:BatA domain-containing protein n=1 Tax=Eudoraea algarum TaxID=3417568 RepID=UPI003D36399B